MVPSANGPGRLQVVPELINVKTGAGMWQQTFDADMNDVLGVQASIATQVAGALGVALGAHDEAAARRPADEEHRRLGSLPQREGADRATTPPR